MRASIFATAFWEGLSVLVIEIAGARALAPYYGLSLKVWTAQITSTLAFLACGYYLGGRLSRTGKSLALPAVFWAAGLWLALFPMLRAAVLETTSDAGVALGSFLASAMLFGLPLLCLGTVSPLLISRLEALGNPGASAAGSLFFTNTLGGLAGGWLTALVLIPHIPLRLALAGSGILLTILGTAWAFSGRSKLSSSAAPLAALILFLISPRPALTLQLSHIPSIVRYRQQSGVGLIEVVDIGPEGRTLLIDGVTQGGMSLHTGTSVYEFTEYLNFLSYRYHPEAKSALLLGLGTGLLAKQLLNRGLDVRVLEIEPKIEEMARTWFGLQDSVKVTREDARAGLGRKPGLYDLVFLDAFAGENAPWTLTTREGMAAIRSVLKPGGRLLVNAITRSGGDSAGMRRMEAAMLEAFGEAMVFVEQPQKDRPTDLVNAALVAGTGLKMTGENFPSLIFEPLKPKLKALEALGRPAKRDSAVEVGTDDFCDLDYAEAELRLEWRKLVFQTLGAGILSD
jgi:spermidine synthase